MKRFARSSVVVLAMSVALTACGKKPPVAIAPPPPGPSAFPGASTSGSGSATAVRPPDPPPVPVESSVSSSPLTPWSDRSVDDINGPESPLKPVHFALDSEEVDETGKVVLAANAEVLKAYPTWVITIEGHSDERGTAEYNLALGDRRALAVKNYLMSLGIGADRLRTVSYGKEFPFDPGHDESAWAKNRRAHFMLTSK